MWHEKTTENIEVLVRPMYCRTDSAPKESLYVWKYEVVIKNHGTTTVQLINRFWKIFDADEQVQEVHGPGVVGERPILQPGQKFEYVSLTHLPTSHGRMVGHYEMVTPEGPSIIVRIPEFKLQLPVRLVAPLASPAELVR